MSFRESPFIRIPFAPEEAPPGQRGNTVFMPDLSRPAVPTMSKYLRAVLNYKFSRTVFKLTGDTTTP